MLCKHALCLHLHLQVWSRHGIIAYFSLIQHKLHWVLSIVTFKSEMISLSLSSTHWHTPSSHRIIVNLWYLLPPTMKQNNHKCSKIQGLQQTTWNAISCITLFKFITMLCGTDDIPCSITGYSPHSLPQNIGMDLNNVMWVIVEVFVVLFVCLPPPLFGVFFCFVFLVSQWRQIAPKVSFINSTLCN